MKAAVVLCVMAALASAGPDTLDPRLEQRRAAEQLETAAQADKDPATFDAAGAAYLALYNADPSSKENDEILYIAGVAFESGHSWSTAIQTYELLQAKYPTSKLSVRALARVGKLYGDLAMYDKAAERLEQYAKKYAGEKDAYDALSDAVFYRRAIGDRSKVIEDSKYFVKTFGAKKPREAADVMWSLTEVYAGDPAATIKHLQEYLRTYGTKGGADRVVMAHARIGQTLWQQSCPHPTVDGLCVKAIERAPRTCGKGTTRTWKVTPRNQPKRLAALKAFATAIKEFERARGGDEGAARYYVAQARLATADDELEAYLALPFPTNLSFDPADRTVQQASLRRFNEWHEQKTKAGGAVTSRYETVLSIKDAASAITAAARFGIVSQSFASSLATAELPRDVRTGANAKDKATAYCDALTVVAEPLEERAAMAFGICLAKSTELGWFSDSSAFCERELIRLKPAEFPPAREVRTAALFDAPVIASEPAHPPR